ncbi:DUF2059 domain-containing protein [Oryzifoliimicrobium ureilyticus]|uniref:DUF2059 domain-containing protein n=1 Tax=Oryzifoliimicrobium ureilyticus TaxID=3113724 RepID=UPI003075EEA3
MMRFAGFGRIAAATVIFSSLSMGSFAFAQEITESHLKAARAAIEAIGATNQFDNILPGLADRLKSGLIQDSPNYEDVIIATVDKQALALASRRADLEKEAALTYAKAFSEDELKQIADFYNSPIGKKLLRDGPIASRETLKAADIWAQGISRDLEKNSNAELAKVIKAPPPATQSPVTPSAPAKPAAKP